MANSAPGPAGRKKPRLIIILLISLFTVLSLGINYVIFKDLILTCFDNGPAVKEPALTEGDRLNPFTNQTLDEVLSGIGGRIPILEYHMIESPFVASNYMRDGSLKKRRATARYFVKSDVFRAQLEKLHERGFRNISLDEYLSLAKGEKKDLERIPPASRLYVLTFDDASYGQFDFLGRDSNGVCIIDPDCAVGIMLDFARRHPDFRLNAAFCVEFSGVPFQQPEYVAKKLNTLLDLGFEIVNHTKDHEYLSRFFPFGRDKAEYQVGRAMELFESYLGYRAAGINKICYPGGFQTPDVWKFVSNFTYNGRTYGFIAGLDASGYQAKNPNESAFNPYCIARIEVSGTALDDFVLDAPDIYRTPSLVERNSNRNVVLR